MALLIGPTLSMWIMLCTWEDVENFNNSGDWSREEKEIKYYSEFTQEDGHIDLKYEGRLIVRDGLARLKDPSGETVSTMATDGVSMPLSIYLANNSMVGESFNYFRDQIEEVVGNVSSLNVTVDEEAGSGTITDVNGEDIGVTI